MSRTEQVEHTNSISSQDPARDEPKKAKSRRPPNTAFRQQRLKAWQPILTPKTVLPLFFIVGVIFAPIGGLLLYASAQVQEISIDYTNCNTSTKAFVNDITNFDPSKEHLEDIPSKRVSATFKSAMQTPPRWGYGWDNYTWPSGTTQNTSVCLLEINIPNDINPPVLFYYRLTNFYQNHRRYVKSVDTEQLKGRARTSGQIDSGDCTPLKLAPDGRPYYPCGLIANSMFNDTFGNLIASNAAAGGSSTYNMTKDGTSWSHEGDLYGKTDYKPQDVVPPPNWKDQYPEDGYNSVQLPNLHTDEQFQVWMRTAGLPTFSKLAQRNDKDVLKAGTYRLAIHDRFPVEKYSGTKSILISTRTVMGGKNPFLGIAYVVVGGICVLLGAVFLATHLIKPRKLGDHTYLTWNNDVPSTATTTGRNTGGA